MQIQAGTGRAMEDPCQKRDSEDNFDGDKVKQIFEQP
jgi:hypothetical protein